MRALPLQAPDDSSTACDPHADPRREAHEERRSSGFTLIEIMAVVIIMGLLMGVVGVTVFSRVDDARVATTRMQVKQIENALEFYRMDNARYPSSEQGLGALIDAPADARNYPPGGYLKDRSALKDQWGNDFQYQAPGQRNPHTFDVWSFGPDGSAGGSGQNADIGNWSSDEVAE